MKTQYLLTPVCAALLFGATGSSLRAQDSSQLAYAPETAAKEGKAPLPKKVHKVWTEDDVSSVRTDADKYLDQKQAATDEAAAAAAKQEKAAKPQVHSGAPPALSNPKSTADADRMIAWEERDLAAQQENVERVRTQLQEAAPEDKDRLQKLLVERMQIVEEVRKERDDLLKQKKAIEKKAAESANSGEPAATPPAQ
jgi:hypothetical protein